MKVHLAGYNVDTVVLEELQKVSGKRVDVTPEVLSASYARISRDPRPIEEIRKDARAEVERTRKSNQTIIFKMGHHSVAEHAVFNLDIIGLSRLAMEEVEKFRLCSFTEKSQRYITLGKDFVIPEEIKSAGFQNEFSEIIELQSKAYYEYFEKLKTYVFDKYPDLAKDPKNNSLLEGWAKEDARYITALATESQVGLTVNARNLELMLRRFASSPLREVNALGSEIYNQIYEVAPSIVIFYKANDKDLYSYPELEKFVSSEITDSGSGSAKEVELLEYSKSGDDIVAAALVHSSSGIPYSKCLALTKKMQKNKKEELFKKAFSNLQFYDSVLREFEYANLTFNIVLSSACFGQLKRHRMATVTSQKYDPALGLTVPDSIKEIGYEKHFKEIVSKTEELYNKIKKASEAAAPYVLTNAHRKRALLRLNARELYHISRLREDAHAQWDIRNVSGEMSRLAKKVMPLTFMLLCGKNKYNEVFSGVFGRPPKFVDAGLPGARQIKS